jgi:hypothetical protein
MLLRFECRVGKEQKWEETGGVCYLPGKCFKIQILASSST